jgi:hypothetical protein
VSLLCSLRVDKIVRQPLLLKSASTGISCDKTSNYVRCILYLRNISTAWLDAILLVCFIGIQYNVSLGPFLNTWFGGGGGFVFCELQEISLCHRHRN